jgi:hypothetical protein
MLNQAFAVCREPLLALFPVLCPPRAKSDRALFYRDAAKQTEPTDPAFLTNLNLRCNIRMVTVGLRKGLLGCGAR